MSRVVIAIALVLRSGRADANSPPPDFEEHELLEHWSWSPLVSAVYAAASREDAPDITAGVYSAELRFRWGKGHTGNASHGEDKPRLFAVSAGIASRSFHTAEPYAAVGVHWLPLVDDLPYRLWLDLRADLAIGRAFEDGTGTMFVRGKVGVGALFSRQLHRDNGRFAWETSRLRGQFDIILIADVFAGGGYRAGIGIEFDPFHLLFDTKRYLDNF